MLNYRPLVYMWIAEYEGGKALPQFDPHTGEENKFSLVDLPRVRRFGWHPFTPQLSRKILKKTVLVTIPTNNPSYVLDLRKGDKLIAKRENIVRFNRKGSEISRETVYVLGKVGGKVLRIKEDGSLDGKRV